MPRLSSYKPPSDPLLIDAAYGYNPLFDILDADDVEAFEEVIEYHAPDDEPIPGGQGDLFVETIRHGSVNCYRSLIEYQKAQAAEGSDLLSPPDMPLWYACRWRRVDMVRYLLSTSDDAQADISTVNRWGHTPLLIACYGFADLRSWAWKQPSPAEALCRSEEIVGMLLDRGANIQDRYCRHYEHPKHKGPKLELCDTVLSLAITNAGPSLIRRLINLGVPLRVPLRFTASSIFPILGTTLMHIAATYANFEAIEILLNLPEARDMIHTRDEHGCLPLHWATGCTTHDVLEWPDERTASRVAATIKLLLLHTSINDPDASGNTPLHHAAIKVPRRLDTVQLLLEQGADPGLANADGDTPAHMAPRGPARLNETHWKDVSREVEKVLDLFEEASKDPSLRDRLNSAGMTPRGILEEERASLVRRVAERGRWLATARGRGRGRGRGKGKGS